MTDKKTENPLDRVKCVVNTCQYHMPGDLCCASKIEIQPRNAQSTEETDCGTFKPNDDGSLQG